MKTELTSLCVHTEYGTITGIRRNGCRVFLGIPFAKPPVGNLAFRHPVPPDPWEDVLPCQAGKANPIQSDGSFSAQYTSQDCLYLNIYVPENVSGPLPVMVWVYGGSYNTGGTGAAAEGSDEINYDLSFFARETNTIVVTFNYRLNLYGFLNLHFLSERFDQNCGLFDQILAMRFVRRNIQAFGGDPENITAFGQSAGGACILALMTMEDAKDLFQKCIIHSSCIEHFFTEKESERNTHTYLRIARIPADQLEMLLDLSSEQVEAINSKYSSRILKHGELRCAFSPTIDGVTLKAEPKSALNSSSLPLLIGCTKQEANLYISPIPSILTPFIALLLGVKVNCGSGEFKTRFSDAVTEHVYRRPMEEILSTYPGPSWRYEYAYVTPSNRINGLGSFHASDLPVLFGQSMPFENIDDPESQQMGKKMRAIWSRFAWNSSPGWAQWDKNLSPHLIS